MSVDDIWLSLTEEEKQKVVDSINGFLKQAKSILIVQDVVKRHIVILKENGMTKSAVKEVLNVFVEEVYKCPCQKETMLS